MEYQSHQKNTFGLQLIDHLLKNIACQVRYNNKSRINNINQQQMHYHHHLHISHRPWSLSQPPSRGWSSRCTHTCVIWLTNRQQIIGVRCSWMTTSTFTNCASITRTLALTLGLLLSSLEPLLHGLETDQFFKRRQDLQMLKELPKESEKELRKMKRWQIWLFVSLGETECLSHDLQKLVNLSLCLFIALY